MEYEINKLGCVRLRSYQNQETCLMLERDRACMCMAFVSVCVVYFRILENPLGSSSVHQQKILRDYMYKFCDKSKSYKRIKLQSNKKGK